MSAPPQPPLKATRRFLLRAVPLLLAMAAPAQADASSFGDTAPAWHMIAESGAPARPKGVPASAVWAGGVDGGAFFACTPSRMDEPNECTVYNDHTGKIWMSGKFVLCGQTRGATADELKYDGADGNKIYLEHNLVLCRVPPNEVEAAPKT
jgi:hypothetical protein